MYMATTPDFWQIQESPFSNVHFVQLQFRLTITRLESLDTFLALLFKKLSRPLPIKNLHTTTLDYHIRYATHTFKIDLQTDPLPRMASQPPKKRGCGFRNMMRKIISDLRKGQLYNAAFISAGQPLGKSLHTSKLPGKI